MLEFTILGLLKEGPMHGYDLRKRMREEFGALENLSTGSVYPVLARLEVGGEDPHNLSHRPGSVRSGTLHRLARWGTGSDRHQACRERRGSCVRRSWDSVAQIYEITPVGEALFERLLDSVEERDNPRSFSLRLAFARHLSPSARLRLLERHQHELTRRLSAADESLSSPSRSLDRYQRSIAEHTRDALRADLTWITSLLERETPAPTAPTGPRTDPEPTTERLASAAAGTSATHDGGIA